MNKEVVHGCICLIIIIVNLIAFFTSNLIISSILLIGSLSLHDRLNLKDTKYHICRIFIILMVIYNIIRFVMNLS